MSEHVVVLRWHHGSRWMLSRKCEWRDRRRVNKDKHRRAVYGRGCCSRQRRNCRNTASFSASVRGAARTSRLIYASKSWKDGCSAEPCAMRCSISSDTLNLVHPGTVAARFTSRHLGWKGG